MSKPCNADHQDDNSVSDFVVKAGTFVLSGTVAVASGIFQGIGDVLGSITDL